MKTRNFTLYVTILVMGAVMTAAGQPARGDRNGNHENNNRFQTTPEDNKQVSGDRNIHYNGRASERERIQREAAVNNNLSARDNSGSGSKNGSVAENPKGYSGNREERAINQNRDNRFENQRNGNHKNEGYTREMNQNRDNNRMERDHGNYSRNEWDHRNYSRSEWEHRKYNWNDRHWDFSNYYRKGYVPYYFRNNHNYWYLPGYGHILRNFSYRPYLFYAGRIPYYFDNGFFYRYVDGIGYIWVENPYDLWFSQLPDHAVRTRINGNIYFRLGNAYFLAGRHGFRLAVLPARYYDPWIDRGVGIEITARF